MRDTPYGATSWIPVFIGMTIFPLWTLQGSGEIRVSSSNPDPQNLPTLSVYDKEEWGQHFIYLSADFPKVRDLVCDLWCFESGGIEFATATPLGMGAIQMRHRWEGQDWDILTTATPSADSVEISARLEPTIQGATEPDSYPGLNICWQLRRAPGFASQPDPYPEFVKRCFIFTTKGRTFLHETERLNIPVREATDEYNNPPWVQMYGPVSKPVQQSGPKSWAAFSTDRYVNPVIGAVSRDGKYLTAIANGSQNVVSQAWHDCMHNNPSWERSEDGAGMVWRLKIYAMENDPDRLLERMREDFPTAF